jgi:hypothetical protein
MRARIYRPPATPCSRAPPAAGSWMLEFFRGEARFIDPLMGWIGSTDTQGQVRLHFDTQAEAEAYAKAHGIDYVLVPPKPRRPNIRPHGYGENFATNRRQVWTH